MNAQEIIDGFEEAQTETASEWGNAFFPGVIL